MFAGFKSQAHLTAEATKRQANADRGGTELADSLVVPEPHTGSTCPSVRADLGSPAENRLLFVGGSVSWYREFEQHLKEARPDWFVQHVVDPAQGEELLGSSTWDALILHTEVSSAKEVIARAQHRSPRLFCLALGQGSVRSKLPVGTDGEAVVPDGTNAVEAADAVVRSVSVNQWTSQLPLSGLLARIKKLPTLPRLHSEVTRELQSPDGSLEVVSQYVRQDPVMAAKFLQMVNSAFFGLAYTVTDPAEAVMFLGSVRTRALILMGGVFSQFDDLKCPGFSAEQVWDHSLQTASFAQGITLAQTEEPKRAEMAFTAGLLHDIGKLILASNVPEMYATAHKLQQLKRIEEAEAESAILNTTHAELGACLLGTWCLPLPIVEAIAWHHQPSRSYDTGFSVLTAVHCANVFAHERSGANTGIGKPSTLDFMYLVRLGLAERRNSWREVCGLEPREEEGTFEDKVRRRSEAKRN
jgi:putative nucleotidyltransferase with HDIG domain